MTDLEADPSVKVVVFQSANPDFFVAHLDVAKAAERPEALGLWRDFVLRLSSATVASIAKIRGRTRGLGNEFVLACDMRFASSGGRTTMTGMHRSTDRRPKSASTSGRAEAAHGEREKRLGRRDEGWARLDADSNDSLIPG